LKKLFELRRGEDKRPKSSFQEELAELIDTGVIPDEQVFVTFSNINKLGINPSSAFDTPLGVYAYPLDYVLNHDRPDELPFAGNRTWAIVFTARGVIYELYDENDDLDEMEEAVMRKLLELADWICAGHPDAEDEIKTRVFDNARLEAFHPDRAESRMWYYTMIAAEMLTEMGIYAKTSIAWNALWRKMGITGVVDYDTGTIHSNEPTQAVFFETKNLSLVSTLRVSQRAPHDPERTRRNAKNTRANIERERMHIDDTKMAPTAVVTNYRSSMWPQLGVTDEDLLKAFDEMRYGFGNANLQNLPRRWRTVEFLTQVVNDTQHGATILVDKDVVVPPAIQELLIARGDMRIAYRPTLDRGAIIRGVKQLVANKSKTRQLSDIIFRPDVQDALGGKMIIDLMEMLFKDRPWMARTGKLQPAVQMEYLRRNPEYLFKMNKVYPVVIKSILRQDPYMILKNKDYKIPADVQLDVVRKDPGLIAYIPNPTPAAQLLAVQLDPNVVSDIDNDYIIPQLRT